MLLLPRRTTSSKSPANSPRTLQLVIIIALALTLVIFAISRLTNVTYAQDPAPPTPTPTPAGDKQGAGDGAASPGPRTRPTITLARYQSPVTEGNTIYFILTASSAPSANLNIKVSVTQTGNYLTGTIPSIITIGGGDTTAWLILQTSNDSVDETDSYVTATILNGTGYYRGSTYQDRILVLDNDDSGPPPPTGLSISIEANDDNNLDLAYTRSSGSTHFYQFQLHRAGVQSGVYTLVRTVSDSISPAHFNNLSYNFWYKAKGRNCRYSNRSSCGSWSSWSNSIHLTNLAPPTNLRLTRSDNNLSLAYTRTTSSYRNYQFRLERATSEYSSYTTTQTVNDNVSPAYFNNQTRDRWYRARGRNCRDSARTDCGSWSFVSNHIRIPPSTATVTLNPPTGITLSVEANDNNDLNLAFTRSSGSTHFYQFQLHRANSRYGTYSLTQTENDTFSPADFDNLSYDYWYKAKGRNCRTSSRNNCTAWTGWSNTVHLTNLVPPTSLNLATSNNNLTVTYTRSTSFLHYYQFQLQRATSQYGSYTAIQTTNDSFSPAYFNNQTRDRWYRARGRNCRDSTRTDCGPWGDYSPTFHFTNPTLTPPTGLSISVNSGNSKQIDLTFTTTTTITSYTYHVFELHRARVEEDFSIFLSSNPLGTVASPRVFSAPQGFWYKARAKACTHTTGDHPCGSWSNWSNVLSPPNTVFNYTPNPLTPGASSNIWTVPTGTTSVHMEVYFSQGSEMSGAINVQRVTRSGTLWNPASTYSISSVDDSQLLYRATAGWYLRVDVGTDATSSDAPLITIDFHSGTDSSEPRIASAFVQLESRSTDPTSPVISISRPDHPVREGDNLVFTVQATSVLTSPATIQYSITGTADSSDYTDTSTNPGTVTIASGSDSNTIVINTIENDDAVENDGAVTASETVTVTLGPVSSQGITLADSGTVKTGVILSPVAISAISDQGWATNDVIAAGEPTWIWLQVKTMPTGATSQDYTNRAYLVKINENPTGDELPTKPATIITAITDPSTNNQPTGYASLGYGQVKWEEGSSPPQQRDIFLAVQPPTAINTLKDYEVTVSKPNFAVIDSPRITTDGTTGTGTAKRGHVTIRAKVRNFTDNSSDTFKHSRKIEVRCVESDSAFESRPESYWFFDLRDNAASALIAANAEKEVQIDAICPGAGLLSGNTVRAETKIDIRQQWVQSSNTIIWPFSLNTLWGPQDTITGGLQLFADVLNCTLSFPLEIRQAGGTQTQAASTTAHCTESGNTWEQGSHPRGNEANVSLGTTFEPLFPSNSLACGIPVANSVYSAMGCRKGDQAYATGASPTTAATVFKPEQKNSPQQTEELLIQHFGRTGTQEWTIVGARPPHTEDTVNKVGRTTGWTSGRIATTYDAQTYPEDPTCPGSKLGHSDNSAGSTYWECLVSTTLGADRGDSGSPVFVLDDIPSTPDTIEVVLVGVLIGGNSATGNPWFVPIERIYAESLLQDYDWATENLRPLPALNDLMNEHLSLDKSDWTIRATFEKTDFSNGPGLTYHAVLHRKDDTGTVSPLGSGSQSPFETQISQTAKVAAFNISDIPLTQRSGEFSVKVKLCVRENLTSNSNFRTKCGDYGPDGGRSLKLPPPAPLNLQAASTTSSNSVDLTWNQVTGAAKYEIKYRIAGSTAAESSQETSSTTTRISGLTCGRSYEFSVRAYGSGTSYSADWGPWSQSVNATVRACPQRRSTRSPDREKDLVPPPPPEGLTATPTGPNAIELAWTEVPAAQSYQVETAVRNTNQWTEYLEDITDIARTVSDLACGTSYDFRVSAFGDGVSYTPEWGQPSAITGGTTGACNRPPEFGASSYTFSIPEDANSGTVVAELSAEDPDEDPLTYAITGGNAAAKFALTPNETPASLTVAAPLDYETMATYTLTLESQDSNGGGATTNVVIHVTDVVESAPPAPSDLSAAATQDTVTLSWGAPDDETVTGYRILRKGPGQQEFEIHVTDTANTETQYIDTVDVNPDTIYEYMVKAINTAGAGPASNVATVQTPATP